MLLWRPGGCNSWTADKNTNVQNAQPNSAVNLAAYYLACENNLQCTGVDYYFGSPAGQRCQLQLPGSGQKNVETQPGVYHYDFNRNCPGNNEFTDQPVCKSPDLLNFIFEEKDRLLWIFLKVCRSVRLIQSSVIMLLTKSWSPDIFNSKSKECTQNSYFLYNSNITLKRFWVKWVTKQQNTA